MSKTLHWLLVVFLGSTLALADTIILKNGSSYSGECGMQTIKFTDQQGIEYQFRVRDVQSLALNTSGDTVALRGGKSYSGHYTGSNPISYEDPKGIKYQFPTRDLDAIVFNFRKAATAAASTPSSKEHLVIPTGTDIEVRTNELINSTDSYEGQTYAAAIAGNVKDAAGQVTIPSGSRAKLMVRTISAGGVTNGSELVLDLFSVAVDQKHHRVASSDFEIPAIKALA